MDIREDPVHCRQLEILNNRKIKKFEVTKASQYYAEGIVKPIVGTPLLQLFKFLRDVLGNKVARQDVEFSIWSFI